MYDEHYGLTGRPFQLTPDPKFWVKATTQSSPPAITAIRRRWLMF